MYIEESNKDFTNTKYTRKLPKKFVLKGSSRYKQEEEIREFQYSCNAIIF